ncbi:MAG: Chemotaxis protein CheY [Legionellaceae bacterium]
MDNFKIKILVVEDDPFSALILKEQLEQANYFVLIAEDGEAAWQLLNRGEHNFSLVIADRMMPKMDGIALTKLIRANPLFSNLPVIMLTSAAEKKEVIAAIKGGVYDFLLKPIEPGLILKVAERALRDQRINL